MFFDVFVVAAVAIFVAMVSCGMSSLGLAHHVGGRGTLSHHGIRQEQRRKLLRKKTTRCNDCNGAKLVGGLMDSSPQRWSIN